MSRNSENKGKFRRPKRDYTMVTNNVAMNSELSLAAKGLYLTIAAYIDIPDFVLYKTFLKKISSCGERAFNKVWNELKDAGFLKIYRIRDKKDNAFIYEYELLLEPDLSSSSSVININVNGEIIDSADSEKENKELSSSAENNVTEESKAEKTTENQTQEDMSYEEAVKLVNKNIEYDCLQSRYDKMQVTNIRDIIVSVLMKKSKSITIGKESVDLAEVKHTFLSLNHLDIEEFFAVLNENPPDSISNPYNYFLTLLYKNKKTLGFKYQYFT